jgi:hypothetical protein
VHQIWNASATRSFLSMSVIHDISCSDLENWILAIWSPVATTHKPMRLFINQLYDHNGVKLIFISYGYNPVLIRWP